VDALEEVEFSTYHKAWSFWGFYGIVSGEIFGEEVDDVTILQPDRLNAETRLEIC